MSDSKWRTDVKENYKTMVMQVGNVTVTVHRPTDLTKEEVRRREDLAKTSMLGLCCPEEAPAIQTA